MLTKMNLRENSTSHNWTKTLCTSFSSGNNFSPLRTENITGKTTLSTGRTHSNCLVFHHHACTLVIHSQEPQRNNVDQNDRCS